MENQTIKIGRKEYLIQKGDYILYNGACYQFCAGNGRTLKWDGHFSMRSLVIPNSALKKIPLETMKKAETPFLTKWYF